MEADKKAIFDLSERDAWKVGSKVMVHYRKEGWKAWREATVAGITETDELECKDEKGVTVKLHRYNQEVMRPLAAKPFHIQLIERSWPAMQKIMIHPFLEDLLKGTLSLDKFQFFIIQDTLYLNAFGACLKLLSERATAFGDEPAHMFLLDRALGIIEVEKHMHKKFIGLWHNEKDFKAAKLTPNGLLYTSYITSICATRPFHEGLAAVLPCFWVYFYVGQCLYERSKTEEFKDVKRRAEYQDWIEQYGGEGFCERVARMVYLTDRVVGRKLAENPKDSMEPMHEHWHKGVQMEWMFWDAAYKMQKWPC